MINRVLAGLLVCVASVSNAQSVTQLGINKIERSQTENRVHLAIIGDGYTEEELGSVYADKVSATLDYMFNHPTKVDPYPRYKNFINIYRIDIASQDSGVDELDKNIYRNTALGGENGCTDYRIGICGVDWELTHDKFEEAAQQFNFSPDWYWVLLHDTAYNAAAHHPSRGILPVYSAHYDGHWDMRDIGLHEAAHAWHRLADEYGGNAHYSGGEPSEANVTANASGAKWSRWLGYQMPSGLEMGVFEGARYHNTGLYRPSRSSKMNGGPDDCHYLGNNCAHNMVAIEKIILDIYEIVDPIDAHLPSESELLDPVSLWVEVVDPDVLKVDWLVDGVTILSKSAQTVAPSELINEPGTYQVSARVWDEVIEHAFSDNTNPSDLDWVRKDLDKLEQTVTWTVTVSPELEPDTDGDGVLDSEDAFPNDASETLDSDGDGVGDNADAFPNDPGRTNDDGDAGSVVFGGAVNVFMIFVVVLLVFGRWSFVGGASFGLLTRKTKPRQLKAALPGITS